ncbi:hypothetical protein RN001_008054 [Aquatica leii]|uniref:CRAL-TRIO domain-containing protein n=1 Tax=Aquatica leii TaxID=1421715 RepID=A0AAN7PAB0_9COLE|nr:hypothetical protein RN001_008054 [Aquatica leii]
MSIRALSTDLQKLAETEINEVSSRVEKDILHIRSWLKYQPHLNVRPGDQWILHFLRGCKFSLEKTKQKIECYYTFRTLIPEFFQNRDPLQSEIQDVLKYGCFWLPLPKPESLDVPRVLYLSTEFLSCIEVSVSNIMKVNFMILDMLMNEDDHFIIAGNQFFNDFNGITINQITQVTPTFIKKCSVSFRDAYPLRSKQVHFINIPNVIETILKPFFGGKHLQRMKIHSSLCLEDLHKVLPKFILPKEFGGEAGTVQELKDKWRKKIESNREWFLNDEKYRSDESKRIGKPKKISDVFGIEGSFRKLEFD